MKCYQFFVIAIFIILSVTESNEMNFICTEDEYYSYLEKYPFKNNNNNNNE